MSRRAVVALFGASLLFGCGKHDNDVEARERWLSNETATHDVYLRRFLNGTPDIIFFDGWWPIEHDPNTGGAWRWMPARSITRLRTKIGKSPIQDMKLTVYGWTAYEHVGVRTEHMDFFVNGYLIEHFEPPNKFFEHSMFVPKWLLEHSDWVDFVITVANTAVPRNDWRDLGFATTGIVWQPAEQK
jgi:hypothetical protein